MRTGCSTPRSSGWRCDIPNGDSLDHAWPQVCCACPYPAPLIHIHGCRHKSATVSRKLPLDQWSKLALVPWRIGRCSAPACAVHFHSTARPCRARTATSIWCLPAPRRAKPCRCASTLPRRRACSCVAHICLPRWCSSLAVHPYVRRTLPTQGLLGKKICSTCGARLCKKCASDHHCGSSVGNTTGAASAWPLEYSMHSTLNDLSCCAWEVRHYRA